MATVIVALDVPGADKALALADQLGDEVSFYKIGLSLFTLEGPAVVRELRARGKRIFLDLKFHDIPNTVARAVESAAALDVELLTLHTTGGAAMMRAAREAAGEHGPRLLGVTLLTSMSAHAVGEVWGRDVATEQEVLRLAGHAAESGLHGVVASPLEAARIRQRHGPGFLVVTPGIRAAGDAAGDQVRTATAAQATAAGADYLVVGRPIIAAADPRAAARAINAEIAHSSSAAS